MKKHHDASPFGGGDTEISADCFGLDVEDLDPFMASKASFRRAEGDGPLPWDSFNTTTNKDSADLFQVTKTRNSSSGSSSSDRDNVKPPKSMRRLGKEKDRVSRGGARRSPTNRSSQQQQQQTDGFDDNFLSSALSQMDKFAAPVATKQTSFDEMSVDPFNIGKEAPPTLVGSSSSSSPPSSRPKSPRRSNNKPTTMMMDTATIEEDFVADFDGFPTSPQKSVNSRSSRSTPIASKRNLLSPSSNKNRNTSSSRSSRGSRDRGSDRGSDRGGDRGSSDRDRDRRRKSRGSRSRDQDYDDEDSVEVDNSDRYDEDYYDDDDGEDFDNHPNLTIDLDDYRDRERSRYGGSAPNDRSTRSARSTQSSTSYKKSPSSRRRDGTSRRVIASEHRRTDISNSYSKANRNAVKESLGRFNADQSDDEDFLAEEGELALSSFLDKKSTRRLGSRNHETESLSSNQNSIKSAPAADRGHYREDRRRRSRGDDRPESRGHRSRDNRTSSSASPHHQRRHFPHPGRSKSHEDTTGFFDDHQHHSEERRGNSHSSPRNHPSSAPSSPTKYSSR
eukprot:CAMPEP_0113465788 /NCGR_PEP_ID=MMETSP0014_2-20120614/13928_1 /TAXON_ID=2857 /ORGANISM="Nitzschia sp." /LENGTH=560 /DNA_ID=CAMNT_0000357973 /DNA_START=165 /DNA_END=1844 /DNA_ORIENTATION=+ /assembly_acc=CAM_ASM_000159